MKTLVLISFWFLSNIAWAGCTSLEKESLRELGYSPTLVERLCLNEEIKQAVLLEKSPAVIMYRGIDIPLEEFNPRYNGFNNSIYMTTDMKSALYFTSYKGTIIEYEVPAFYVWGLEADYAWISVNKKFAKRKNGVRSLPNGIDDVAIFVTRLGRVEEVSILNLLQSKGYNRATYNVDNFWDEFGHQANTFLSFQPFNYCDTFFQ